VLTGGGGLSEFGDGGGRKTVRRSLSSTGPD